MLFQLNTTNLYALTKLSQSDLACYALHARKSQCKQSVEKTTTTKSSY